MTLIEIVQGVLSNLDSDEVNSVSDTVEAEQVALLAKEVYLNLASERAWPWERRLISLEASGDSTKPTLMKIPEYVNRIEEIMYDISCDEKQYKIIPYSKPYDFLNRIYKFDATQDNTGSYTLLTRPDDKTTTQEVLYKNDEMPQCWTSFDDTFIVFDCYDATVDDTLQTSKTVAWGEVQPTFTILDEFVPNLPEHFWPLYLNELRSLAFVNLKQTANAKYAADARRSKIRLQKSAWRENGKPTTPDFGR
jgi:hypothetical protein